MPTVTFQKKRTVRTGVEVTTIAQTKDWIRNNRLPSGAIDLRATNYLLDRREVLGWQAPPGYENAIPKAAPDTYNAWPGIWNGMAVSCERESYGKFRGRLYYGNAQLGVTIAEWRKAKATLMADYAVVRREYGKFWHLLLTKGWTPLVMANRTLEFFFFLKPTYQSIHATVTSVVQHAPPSTWVRASARTQSFLERPDGVQVWNEYRMSRAGRATIINQNAWLAERAGIYNPATVAWDLVPWSFMVNMFVNINELVSSLTDFVGLSFTDYSETRAARYRMRLDRSKIYGRPVWGSYQGLDHRRAVLAYPVAPRSLHFRIPGADFQTLAIHASLSTQQWGKLRQYLQWHNVPLNNRRSKGA